MSSLFGWLFGKKVGHIAVPTPDFRVLKRSSVFLKAELRVLFARYCDSCQDDGMLSKARFMFMPELVYSPFAGLAFHYEAEKLNSQGESIDFPGFVNILSHLSPKADALEKIDYLFLVLKVGTGAADGGKYLHKEEVSSIMYQLCLGTVPPPVLDKVMESMWDTITAADPEAWTRGITKSDLAALFSSLDLQTYMTCPF